MTPMTYGSLIFNSFRRLTAHDLLGRVLGIGRTDVRGNFLGRDQVTQIYRDHEASLSGQTFLAADLSSEFFLV